MENSVLRKFEDKSLKEREINSLKNYWLGFMAGVISMQMKLLSFLTAITMGLTGKKIQHFRPPLLKWRTFSKSII